MLEILIIVALIGVMAAVNEVIASYRRSKQRKTQIEEFEKKYPPKSKD